MAARNRLGFALMLMAGCTSSESLSDFHYSSGNQNPGANLPEGGEIRHENVRLLGNQEDWLAVYQYAGTGASSAPLADIDTILEGGSGNGQWGPCIDERTTHSPTGNTTGGNTWPFQPITNATYEHFPSVPTLTGTGISGSLPIVEMNPPNTVGNSTLRTYDFTYGGGAPGSNFASTFNGGLTTEEAAGSGVYTLDMGEGDAITYTFVASFTAPLGIGGSANVNVPAGQDLVATWDAPANVFGTGNEHVQNTYFNFMLFVDPTVPTAEFMCFMDLSKPGTLTIPAAVISAIQSENGGSGLIVDANLTHQMLSETNPADPNKQARRFDIVTIWCNISTFSIQ